MRRKIVKLTESDLKRIVKRVLKENYQNESLGKMFKNIGKRISGDIFSHTIQDDNDPFLRYVRELHGEDVDYIVVNPPEDQFGVGGDLMVGTYNYFRCADEECSYHHGWSDTVPRQFKDYIYKDF